MVKLGGTVEERAARFAHALCSTCDRYHHGMITRTTWDTHMKSLWGQIEQDPAVRRAVVTMIDPLNNRNLRRGADRR